MLSLLTSWWSVHQIQRRSKQEWEFINYTKIVSEYDQVLPQSQTADKPVTPSGRATQNHKTPGRQTKQSNQLSLPIEIIAKINGQQNIEKLQNNYKSNLCILLLPNQTIRCGYPKNLLDKTVLSTEIKCFNQESRQLPHFNAP